MSDRKFIKSTNIVTVESQIAREDRIVRNGHKGGVLWFTGLSGSGKSILATELERRLFNAGYNVYVLDGDNVRHGLSSNLGFSPADESGIFTRRPDREYPPHRRNRGVVRECRADRDHRLGPLGMVGGERGTDQTTQ